MTVQLHNDTDSCICTVQSASVDNAHLSRARLLLPPLSGPTSFFAHCKQCANLATCFFFIFIFYARTKRTVVIFCAFAFVVAATDKKVEGWKSDRRRRRRREKEGGEGKSDRKKERERKREEGKRERKKEREKERRGKERKKEDAEMEPGEDEPKNTVTK